MAGVLSKPLPIADIDDRDSKDYVYLGRKLGVRLISSNKGPRLQLRRFYMDFDTDGPKTDADGNQIYNIGSCVSLTLLELTLLSDNIQFLIDSVKGADHFGSVRPVINDRPPRSLGDTDGYMGPPLARRPTNRLDVHDCGGCSNKENIPPRYKKKTQGGSSRFMESHPNAGKIHSGYGDGQGSGQGSRSDLFLGMKSQDDMPPLVFQTDDQDDEPEDGGYFGAFGNRHR